MVDQRQRWGVIGRNGSGKTTLFRLITGEQDPNSGHREPGERASGDDAGPASGVSRGRNGVGRRPLALRPSGGVGASDADPCRSNRRAGERAPKELLQRYDRDLEQFQRADGYAIDARVAAVLQGLDSIPTGHGLS